MFSFILNQVEHGLSLTYLGVGYPVLYKSFQIDRKACGVKGEKAIRERAKRRSEAAFCLLLTGKKQKQGSKWLSAEFEMCECVNSWWVFGQSEKVTVLTLPFGFFGWILWWRSRKLQQNRRDSWRPSVAVCLFCCFLFLSSWSFFKSFRNKPTVQFLLNLKLKFQSSSSFGRHWHCWPTRSSHHLIVLSRKWSPKEQVSEHWIQF